MKDSLLRKAREATDAELREWLREGSRIVRAAAAAELKRRERGARELETKGSA